MAYGEAGIPTNHNNRAIKTNNINIIKIIKNSINTIKHNKYGSYSKDTIRVLQLNNGGKSRLLETLIFTDPYGKKWVAPKGHIIDGASIPLPLQPIIGTPYGGKYVMASIIHDVACDEKKSSWKEVHKVFHYAMLASGVSSKRASLMYNAVYEGGPRWGVDAEKKLSNKEFEKLISNPEFKSLIKDFKIISGELKNYSGTAVYIGKREGKRIVGVVKKYNATYIKFEIGNSKPLVGVGWERPSEWGGQETTDRAMKELRKAHRDKVVK